MSMEDGTCGKCKCVFIDEDGSQSSCSLNEDYIVREFEKIELVFKAEEVEGEDEPPGGDAYSSDSHISIGDDETRCCIETDFSEDDNKTIINLDAVLQKDTSAFLFRNEDMEPLSFVLLLNDSSAELKLTKMIERSGGLVYRKVKDMDDYSIVIVKDDKLLTSHIGPVFKIEYLFKCVAKNRIVSINPYQRTFNNAPPLHNFDFMRVVYFKQLAWSEVPDDILLNKPYVKKVKLEKEPEITPSRPILCTVQESDDDDVQKTNKTQKRSQDSDDQVQKNKTQQRSQDSDDQVQKNNKTQQRSQDSDDQVRKNNKTQQRSQDSDDQVRKNNKTQQHPPHKKFKLTFFGSSSDDSESDLDNNSKAPNASVTKPEKFKRKVVNRHTRMKYSDQEDINIVRYIADNDVYNAIKGRLVWQDMERVNICPKRTWQSMKEHFLKKIIYNTNSYTFLTDSQKRKFQKLLL